MAGIVGIGAVLDDSGLGRQLAGVVGHLVALGGSDAVSSLAILAGIAAVLGLLVTIVAVPAILTPIAKGLAVTTGLPVDVVAMSQVVGFSTVFFPYQAPPLAVAAQTSPPLAET